MYKIYDFECTKCGQIEERILDDKESLHVVCSICGGKVKKLLAAPPFHLKGSGWAKDNYGLKEKPSKTPKE